MNPHFLAQIVAALGNELDELKRKRANTAGRANITSLAAEAKRSTAMFPLLVTKSISANTLYLISKALERKYAVQMKLVIQGYFRTNAGSIFDYLDQFHNNLDTTGSAHGGPLDLTKTNPLGLDESILMKPFYEELNFDNAGYNIGLKNINEATSRGVLNRMNSSTPRVEKISDNFFTSTDCKKANELVPTIIPVSAVFTTDPANPITKQFNVAVKTVIHPVTSDDMIDNMIKATERSNGLFNFIKATTGEISFLKDFVLMINQTKDDHISKGSGIWNKLRERRMQNGMRNVFRYAKGMIPNTTLVMSIGEIEFLLNEHKINILSVGIARDIIKEYFLSAIVVVDESTEILHVIDDASSSFEQLTFNALSKEMDKSSDLKTVVNLMKTRGGY